MKERRNLSGVYFRSLNEQTKKYDNVVFEDLSEEEQDIVMNGRSEEWLKILAKQLSKTLNKIGNQFDIISEEAE